MKPRLVVGVILLVVLGLFATTRLRYQGRVQGSVRVGDVELGGLTLEQAIAALKPVAKGLHKRKLALRVESKLFELAASELGLSVDVEASASKAYARGREGSLPLQFVGWVRGLARPPKLDFEVRANQAAFEQALEQLEARAVEGRPLPGGIVVENQRALPVYPKPGQAIDRQRAVVLLSRALLADDDEVVNLPVSSYPSKVSREDVDQVVSLANQLLKAPVSLVHQHRPGTEATSRIPERGESQVVFLLDPTFFTEALSSQPNQQEDALSLTLDGKRLEDKLAKVLPLVETPPINARFVAESAEKLRIDPSREGLRIDRERVLEAAVEASLASDRRASLPVIAEAPRLTTEQAQALKIRGLVSHFTTRFPCCPPRVKNIARIAELLNHTIVAPGATFSVNQVVGERTVAKGFVPAPSIEDGEMVDTVGGGISQFATTLYNALFHAGYEIVSHQPHSYYFARYPMGHEATLSWPKPDLIFRNDTGAGLLIVTRVTKGEVAVLLYGDVEGREVNVTVSPARDVKLPDVRLVADPEVPPHRERVEQAGKQGWTVEVARKLRFRDGTERQESRRVTYKPEPRLIHVHPCRIPEGEPDYTGTPCPLPEADTDETARAAGAVEAREPP